MSVKQSRDISFDSLTWHIKIAQNTHASETSNICSPWQRARAEMGFISRRVVLSFKRH